MPHIMNDTPKPKPKPPKLTPWFPRSIKPVRDGVYQVQFDAGFHVVRATWRQNSWWLGNRSAGARYWPLFRWRGLAQDPRG